jgi:hypothetical protein
MAVFTGCNTVDLSEGGDKRAGIGKSAVQGYLGNGKIAAD